MNENVVRNEFDEMTFAVISALNGLMQTREVCKQGSSVTKINRFKSWVLDLQDTVNNARQTAENAPATINFNPSDCPEIAD